jgi:uncharacterized protein (TIGR02611 family)
VGIRPAFDETDERATVLEAVAERMGWRDRLRARPVLGWVYRVLVALAGTAVIVVGVIMLPAPGPGWVVIFAGLGILATEFAWARRVLAYAKSKIQQWTRWAQRQSLAVRAAIGLAGLILLAGLVLVGLATVGVNPFHVA